MEKSKLNYTLLHLHSMLSNGVTNIDSVTKFEEYVEQAKKCGMKALAFTEHGSVFNWWHKKCVIEAAGMKYIHACEMYVTETLKDKVRDNYHCVLIAKNTEGLKELNRLISRSFNRNDNHFYYVPRISLDELTTTSDNILITTACLGGILYSGNEQVKTKFLHFILANKNRCFLEIQHHRVFEQIEYNEYLYKLNQQYGIKLVAGTDTHALNETHLRGRTMLQKSKDIHFDNEADWDLAFKTYDELLSAYSAQMSIPQEAYLEAIENTNVIANMIEFYDIDRSIKYPKIYNNPLETFKEKIANSIEKHPYIHQRYTTSEINERVKKELEVYQKTQSIDFMLLQTYLREWERGRGIACGYSRGSVSGSMIAYILGITEMDSVKFNLNFFRFQNPSRITVCDIDSDYGGTDRDTVKEFLLRDHMNLPSLQSCEIITFNTIALKGAIRDIGRALDMPLSEVGKICDCVYTDENNKFVIDDNVRSHYPTLFEYVDIVQGTVVSIGTHPSGVLLSDYDIEANIGLCSTSQSDYPSSMLNMKELDDLMYVKLDILG